MAQARFEDAAIGWEYFRDSGGDLSLTEINQALRQRGQRQIAQRTYSHYQKLARLGYQEYVSINRLDVRHANDSIFDLVDRSRYSDKEVDFPGRLVVPRRTDVLVLSGRVTRVSEGFASLRVPEADEAQAAARATTYNKGILILDRVDVERAVEVIEAVPADDELELLLSFRSLLELDLLTPQEPQVVVTSRVLVHLGESPSLFQVVETIHRMFDLYESLRGLADLAIGTANGDKGESEGLVLPAPRIQRLEIRNPLEVIVVGSGVVIAGVAFVLQKVLEATREGVGLAIDKKSLSAVSDDQRRAEERHQLAIESLQLDVVKKKIEIADLLGALSPEIREALGIDLEALGDASMERLDALKDQAVEAGAELALTSGGDVSVDPEYEGE